MLGRLSLRARLLLGVIALAAVGLVAADVITYSKLSSFLIERTDTALNAAHQAVEGALTRPSGGPGPGQGPGGDIGALTAAAPGDYIQLRSLNGTILASGFVPQFSNAALPPEPRLPATITLPTATNVGRDRVTYLTVPARSGGGRYRVRASIEPQAPNRIVIVAASLADVDSTLHQLLLIELLVTALVLAAIGALGLWVIRLSLRPLDAIETTAAAIAAGDLTQRVERADEQTEVGRLGLALNAMLAQIEEAFKAREEQKIVDEHAHPLRLAADPRHRAREVVGP